MPLEGREGTELVAHKRDPVDDEAQRAESLQNDMGPSSTNVIANMGTQVLRPQYFLLLEIDGFLMWQRFGHYGPLKDHLRLMVREKLHYFLRPGLKEFLEFCLNNFEVMFWTTAEDRTLEPQYEQLLKACPALGEYCPRFGRCCMRAQFNKRCKETIRARVRSITFLFFWPEQGNFLGIRVIRDLEKKRRRKH